MNSRVDSQSVSIVLGKLREREIGQTEKGERKLSEAKPGREEGGRRGRPTL